MIQEKTVVSDFAKEFNFDDIRPYYDHEVHDMLQEVIKDPLFMKLINYLWPQMTEAQVQEKASGINNSLEFQLRFMNDAVQKIVSLSSSGLSTSGFDKLDKTKTYLFVANHRDIFLDAAILQIVLVQHGFPTSEISFGDNLIQQGFITNFVKLNRMFTIMREGTNKELYEKSRKLSAYIRHTLLDKKSSVWIAQRNGRTKDGADTTQSGLLKMLNISAKKNFVANFKELNIVPLSISYEYEPCDFLKTQELYLSSVNEKYTKAPGEDLNSILTGINQFKGKIHLAAGSPVTEAQLLELDKLENDNEKIKALALLIDKQIFENYKCNPVNYIAADLLSTSPKHNAKYSENEKSEFMTYVNKNISKLKGDQSQLEKVFLKMYAAPVINKDN